MIFVYALNKKIEDVETSFQDGCSTVASAITAMGVSTASNASPATMAANIKKISSGYYKQHYYNGWMSADTANSITVSITDYPYYKNITKDNIHIGISSWGKENSTEASGGITWTYNASTGVITINRSGSMAMRYPTFQICVIK